MNEGELFSRTYLRTGVPTQDSMRFRNRLYGQMQLNHSRDSSWYEVAQALRQSGGLDIQGSFGGFRTFLLQSPIQDILDFVTLYWRRAGGDTAYDSRPEKWRSFVSTALKEENLGYRLDGKCGVHYFVDEEFERNRVSALSALDAPPLRAARTALEEAHRYLDPGSRDTKTSVRSAFEALEIVVRLMFPEQKNLNKWLVENKLKPLAVGAAKDETEAKAVSLTFDGLAQMIDGLHIYRHGQPVVEPAAPTLDFAVFTLSSIAAALRWIVVLAPPGSPIRG